MSPTVAKKRSSKSAIRSKVVTFRCSPDFYQWLEEVSESQRLTPSQVLEFGCIDFAEKRGLEAPPRR